MKYSLNLMSHPHQCIRKLPIIGWYRTSYTPFTHAATVSLGNCIPPSLNVHTQ